jgi:hypothetical protein
MSELSVAALQCRRVGAAAAVVAIMRGCWRSCWAAGVAASGSAQCHSLVGWIVVHSYGWLLLLLLLGMARPLTVTCTSHDINAQRCCVRQATSID